MMHRAARSLTINTSNACLVDNFRASLSFSSTSASSPVAAADAADAVGHYRPYTPPPPSCRLHKIYEEKLDILGAFGHDNWFDDHANPFYRHLEHVRQQPHPVVDSDGHCNHAKHLRNSLESVDIVVEAVPSNSTCMRTFQPCSSSTSSSSCGCDESRMDTGRTLATPLDESLTGFESFLDEGSNSAISNGGDAASDSDVSADEIRPLVFDSGYLDFFPSSSTSKDQEAAQVQSLYQPSSELENRRLKYRNTIMDRGRLMPDTLFTRTLCRCLSQESRGQL